MILLTLNHFAMYKFTFGMKGLVGFKNTASHILMKCWDCICSHSF